MKFEPINGNGKTGHKNGHSLATIATTRDFMAILFRQRRILIFSFLGIFLAATLFFLFVADRYQAQIMILVDRDERANPIATSGPNSTPSLRSEVTEEEMNSEAALLQSRDLLEQVVLACGLENPKPRSFLSRLMDRSNPPKDVRIERAVRGLANKLEIEVGKRANVIIIKYPSSNPKLAAQVVQTLGDLYLKKHASVHRPPGEAAFFEQQTESYKNALSQAESQLVRFTHDQGVVAAPLETEATLRKLDEFEGMEGQTKAEIAQTQERIRALEAQKAKLSTRLTTSVRVSDSPQLLEQAKSALLTLELKRTELLEKFEPTYRPVQEVEKQIAQTKAAIADAERTQWREETTDRDPNFEMVRQELTKAHAELAGLQARESALGRTVRTYESKAEWLHQQGIRQADLIRTAKAEEDNYLLYLRKREEAKISDALDTRNILNVTVAEAATIPVLPLHSNFFYLLASGFVGVLGAFGLAFAADRCDPTLRTPDEVESLLDIPVLLSVPQKSNGKANGNGHGNGNGNGHAKIDDKSNGGIVLHVS